MSTKSIFKNVNLNSRKKVLRFLKALEEAERKSGKEKTRTKIMNNEYFVRVLVKNGGIEIPLFSKGMKTKEQAERLKKILDWCLTDKVDITENCEEEIERVGKAKWIKHVEHGVYWFVCSNCGEDVPKNRYGYDSFSSYCPNCGFKIYDIELEEVECQDL